MSTPIPKPERIIAYTDGSSVPNPGPGGYGVVIPISETEETTLSKGFKRTTNNRMELLAVIALLEEFGPNKEFDIYLDSAYAMNGCRFWVKAWARNNWIRRDWKTGEIKSIQNLDLWQRVYPLLKENKVNFYKVVAHTGVKYNEMADKLAGEAGVNATEIDEGYVENGK